MKKAKILSVLIITIFCFSGIICSHQIITDVSDLEKYFQKWWSYHNSNIFLSPNFIAIDNSSNTVTKEKFLSMLTSCEFIPIKQLTINNSNRYKINKLGKMVDKDISMTIKNISAKYYANFKMEGKAIPKFNFEDKWS
jgi:hypothetical protein